MNMNKLDETARLFAKKDVSSLQKLAVQMKKHIEHVKPISSHLIRKLDVDELGTVLIPEERQWLNQVDVCLRQGKLTQN